jgi:hypothetical protein
MKYYVELREKETSTYNKMKTKWIGQIVHRKCLLNHVTEGKIKRMRRGGRRLKQPLDDLKENRRYWHLKEKALDRSLWKTHWKYCALIFFL